MFYVLLNKEPTQTRVFFIKYKLTSTVCYLYIDIKFFKHMVNKLKQINILKLYCI